MISGYPDPAYDAALAGWRRVSCRSMGDGALVRTEVLWINPAACARLDRQLRFDDAEAHAHAAA